MLKIVFFIGSLRSGGKERRLIELLSYLKKHTDYEILVVLRQNLIDYPAFYKLDIPHKLLTEAYKKKDFSLPYHFYKIAKEFRPHIIHTWGATPTTISILSVVLLKIHLINSQITSAPPNYNKWRFTNFINKLNFHFSDVILSNSKAGLEVYKPSQKKSKVIYNGIRLERFEGLPPTSSIKDKYHINTPFAVVMVGSFSKNKNFDLFLEVADSITQVRVDISFVCAGDGDNYNRLFEKYELNKNIIFAGRINEVEALVNVCDIGVLISNKKVHGEGISNTITEYMALKKPVIANDAGGTKEIVVDGVNGYLITNESNSEIQKRILELIDDSEKRIEMGSSARKTIEEKFAINKMGEAFINVYKYFLPQ